jgi:hypothetical protein
MIAEECCPFTDARPDDEKWALDEAEPTLNAVRNRQSTGRNVIVAHDPRARGHLAVLPELGVRVSEGSESWSFLPIIADATRTSKTFVK